MKNFSLIVALALAMCTASTAMAQQFQFAGFQDVETAFADQQTRMAQLEAQLATFQDAVGEPGQDVVGVKGCGKGCCDPCCCCGGWWAGGEVVVLKDHAHDGYNADESEVGYRLYVGYEGCDGLGVAVRYFDYDNGNDPNYGNELMYLDLELTTNLEICNTQIMLSGGYRHANVHIQDDYDVWSNLNGLTFGVRAQREICCNLSVFAWLQESFLFGRDADDDYPNSHFNWAEAQLGLQYNTCLGGRNAWVRAGCEAHDIRAPFDDYYYNAPGEFGYFLGGGMNY